MTLECISPEDLPAPLTYTQVAVATGSRLVFVAGQEPEDEHGNLVGPGDLAVQARQVLANLGRALAGLADEHLMLRHRVSAPTMNRALDDRRRARLKRPGGGCQEVPVSRSNAGRVAAVS